MFNAKARAFKITHDYNWKRVSSCFGMQLNFKLIKNWNIFKMELKLDKLNWKSTRKTMNGEKSTSRKGPINILRGCAFAPTSSGFTTFEYFGWLPIKKSKKKIKPVAWNQSGHYRCSHFISFCPLWDTTPQIVLIILFDLTTKFVVLKNEAWKITVRCLLDTYPQKDAKKTFNHCCKHTSL